jgi:hypothetical protein
VFATCVAAGRDQGDALRGELLAHSKRGCEGRWAGGLDEVTRRLDRQRLTLTGPQALMEPYLPTASLVELLALRANTSATR